MTFILGLCTLFLTLFLLLWLFLILPRVTGRADMELLCRDYAHRGLWGNGIPENSLSAFAEAVQRGYGIELDLQLSKDRVLMVFHDDTLNRLCGVSGRIGEMTCAELKRLRLVGTDETIPTLSEVLALVRGRVPLMIEIKGERTDPVLCRRAVHLLDAYMGPFCIVSFSPLILRWFKHYRPTYARGQLVTRITKHQRKGSRLISLLLSHVLLNVLSRPDFLSVNERYRRRPVYRFCLRILRIPCFAWTVRAKQDRQKLRKQGWHCIFERICP
ncbi:MAG: glycerophosphodiester phosphodiesterase [Ruminococcaceae bacterium]|nr:glycerophosphodiester phosphodiesterase [Oscillospiraceae bacterium]